MSIGKPHSTLRDEFYGPISFSFNSNIAFSEMDMFNVFDV